MYDLNISVRSGRLAANPELKTSSSGQQFVYFQLAVNRNSEKADFFTYKAWNENAQFIERHCRKGTKLNIVGQDLIEIRQNKDGKKVKYFETKVISVHFAESRQAAESAIPQPQELTLEDEDLPF